MFLQCNYWLN